MAPLAIARSVQPHLGRATWLFAPAVLALVLGSACSKVDNPDFCCTHDCEAHGASGPTACDSPRVCDPDKFTCIAPIGCQGPQDCAGSVTPYCVMNVCRQCDGQMGCSAATPVCGSDNICGTCSREEDCAPYAQAGTPHCGSSGACIQCRNAMDCGDPGAPVCDASACRGCQMDSECSSNVCDRSTGACIAEDTVIYLAPSGVSSGTCTKAMPCNTFALGIAQVGGGRHVIKAEPGSYSGQIVLTNITVTIYGDGATASPSSFGQVIVVVGDGSDVTIDGLHITGAGGGTGTPPVGVVCTGVGGAKLRLHRTLVDSNAGGGVKLNNCEFDLVNNFIVQNGGLQSTFGGVLIQSPPAVGLRALDFNTIAGNTGAAGLVTGVHCDTVTTALTFDSNVVYGNLVSNGGKQVDTQNCNYVYSDIGDSVNGAGNTTADPAFADQAHGNFHLGASSPAIDAADPASTLGVDFDGDKRPKGTRRDIGADEAM